MAENIYLFRDYKRWIKSQIHSARGIRGYQGVLSSAAGCQASFLSRVLRGSAHLTPEHGAGLAVFWQLNDTETEWFLSLIQLARAGTPRLRQIFSSRLEQLKKKQEDLSLAPSSGLLSDEGIRGYYYSAWYISAIHVYLSVPGFDSADKLAQQLGIREATVASALEKLKQIGLARVENGKWTIGPSQVHVGKESPHALKHHSHWRDQALQAANGHQSMNYTALHSLSVDDLERVRQEIIAMIRRTAETVARSPEEKVVCLNIDLFEV